MVTLYIRESYYARDCYRVETLLEKDVKRFVNSINGTAYTFDGFTFKAVAL